jgi:hypothetical protein
VSPPRRTGLLVRRIVPNDLGLRQIGGGGLVGCLGHAAGLRVLRLRCVLLVILPRGRSRGLTRLCSISAALSGDGATPSPGTPPGVFQSQA